MELLDGEMEHTMDSKMDDIFYDLPYQDVPFTEYSCWIISAGVLSTANYMLISNESWLVSQDLAQILCIHLALVGVISGYIVLVVTTYPDNDLSISLCIFLCTRRSLCHTSLQSDGRVQGNMHDEVGK